MKAAFKLCLISSFGGGGGVEGVGGGPWHEEQSEAVSHHIPWWVEWVASALKEVKKKKRIINK